jgi:hypothetical protein
MREFLLSLGVLLGVVAAQPDPVLGARLYRDAQSLYATAEVRDGLGKDALALVTAGDTLRLVLEYQLEGGLPRLCAHEISYDPISRIYQVKLSETQGLHQTTSAEAAADIFCRFYGIRVEAIANLRPPLRADFTARLVDATKLDVESAGLWNYRSPQASVSLPSLTELAW